ncbi:MAG TPA: amino acid ABC transporter permease [Candidatus Limnocylindria bacterium]|nr:amino acid ABC transporter permease [Candidatus Limnocylindria bacterium]
MDLRIFFEALFNPALLQGVQITILLTIVAMIFGLVLGLGVALMREHSSRIVRGAAWIYVWFFRGVPTIVLLLIVWTGLPQVFTVLTERWFSPFFAASIALSFNEAAYSSEIFRGGMLAVDDGQRLAARALGLAPRKVFGKVVLPQVLRVVIPPLSNDLITMLKITGLAAFISLRELLANTRTVVAGNFRSMEYYLAAAVYYLVLVTILMVFQAWLERRFRWSSQRAESKPGGLIKQFAPLR